MEETLTNFMMETILKLQSLTEVKVFLLLEHPKRQKRRYCGSKTLIDQFETCQTGLSYQKTSDVFVELDPKPVTLVERVASREQEVGGNSPNPSTRAIEGGLSANDCEKKYVPSETQPSSIPEQRRVPDQPTIPSELVTSNQTATSHLQAIFRQSSGNPPAISNLPAIPNHPSMPLYPTVSNHPRLPNRSILPKLPSVPSDHLQQSQMMVLWSGEANSGPPTSVLDPMRMDASRQAPLAPVSSARDDRALEPVLFGINDGKVKEETRISTIPEYFISDDEEDDADDDVDVKNATSSTSFFLNDSDLGPFVDPGTDSWRFDAVDAEYCFQSSNSPLANYDDNDPRAFFDALQNPDLEHQKFAALTKYVPFIVSRENQSMYCKILLVLVFSETLSGPIHQSN